MIRVVRFQKLLFLIVMLSIVLGISLAQVKDTTIMPKVDEVLIEKSKRKLMLLHTGHVVRSYSIALGKSPKGHKLMQGDGKTPEGRYTVDYKFKHSRFYRAFHISYPNAIDVERARVQHISPGGDIEIHGLPPKWRWIGSLHRLWDWTDGCIAMTNQEIDEIWDAIPLGTLIVIRP